MKHFKNLYQFVTAPQLLFFYTLAAIMIPNVALCFTEDMPLLYNICNIVMPMSVYAYILTLKGRPGIMTWILFPLLFIAAFQLVQFYMFGSAIISVDMFLNVATTNVDEAAELLKNIKPIVICVCIIYLPALILSVCSTVRKVQLTKKFVTSARYYSYVGMTAGILLTGICNMAYRDYHLHMHMFPLNVGHNLLLAIERSYDIANYAETSADFSYKAHATHDASQPEAYVLVIGETARACSWGLYGYNRDTNPLLKKRNGLTVFSDVMTQANVTHISVPMIMSLASAEDYDRIYNEKGIMTAFREAGFYTAFISNQGYNHSFIDIFGNEADSVVFIREGDNHGKNINDLDLEAKVKEVIAAGHKKLFIVVHMYGSHFNYWRRYNDEFSVFTPDMVCDSKYENRQTLMNAYDNTIVQTDKLIDDLIGCLDKNGVASALLYTSDHGEDIYDDGRKRLLHSSPVPTYYQMHVPFIIWTSDTYGGRYPDIVNKMKDNSDKPVASNASIIHTMFDIAGIETPFLTDSLSVASERYNVSKRNFISDHNLPIPYDKLGLDDEDFEMFKKHRLRPY